MMLWEGVITTTESSSRSWIRGSTQSGKKAWQGDASGRYKPQQEAEQRSQESPRGLQEPHQEPEEEEKPVKEEGNGRPARVQRAGFATR